MRRWRIGFVVVLGVLGACSSGGSDPGVSSVAAATSAPVEIDEPEDQSADPDVEESAPTEIDDEEPATGEVVNVERTSPEPPEEPFRGEPVDFGDVAAFGELQHVIVTDIRWLDGHDGDLSEFAGGLFEADPTDEFIEVELEARSLWNRASLGPELILFCPDDGSGRTAFSGGPVQWADIEPLGSVSGVEVVPVPSTCPAPHLLVGVSGILGFAEYELPTR